MGKMGNLSGRLHVEVPRGRVERPRGGGDVASPVYNGTKILIASIPSTFYTKYFPLFFRCGTILLTFLLVISGHVAPSGVSDQCAIDRAR